jgi:hypothetical protein
MVLLFRDRKKTTEQPSRSAGEMTVHSRVETRESVQLEHGLNVEGLGARAAQRTPEGIVRPAYAEYFPNGSGGISGLSLAVFHASFIDQCILH